MIWLAIALLAVAVLAPLGSVLERRANSRGPRDLAMALHRAQLTELDRDLAENRILPAEHATARLEVQRRLLTVAGQAEPASQPAARWPVLAALVAVPVLAFALYLVTGSPGLPSLTTADNQARQARAMEDGALIAQLRQRLQTLDPASDQARQGYTLLGNAEYARGNFPAAAEAWRKALDARFDPDLAVRLADADIRAENGMTPATEALLRRALAAAPPDAPWRAAVEAQLRK